MHITPTEAQKISALVRPCFDELLVRYDFEKYPAEHYERFKREFSEIHGMPSIEDALRWKWGHWKKRSFPESHKALIKEVTNSWPEFVASAEARNSRSTFEWWSTRLSRRTTYITAAFLTHLVHHVQLCPIIDQHNFRAMNAFLAIVRTGHVGKKKPSTWSDIDNLRAFLLTLLPHLEGRTFDELDRFLMMYGRHRATR